MKQVNRHLLIHRFLHRGQITVLFPQGKGTVLIAAIEIALTLIDRIAADRAFPDLFPVIRPVRKPLSLCIRDGTALGEHLFDQGENIRHERFSRGLSPLHRKQAVFPIRCHLCRFQVLRHKGDHF